MTHAVASEDRVMTEADGEDVDDLRGMHRVGWHTTALSCGSWDGSIGALVQAIFELVDRIDEQDEDIRQLEELAGRSGDAPENAPRIATRLLQARRGYEIRRGPGQQAGGRVPLFDAQRAARFGDAAHALMGIRGGERVTALLEALGAALDEAAQWAAAASAERARATELDRELGAREQDIADMLGHSDMADYSWEEVLNEIAELARARHPSTCAVVRCHAAAMPGRGDPLASPRRPRLCARHTEARVREYERRSGRPSHEGVIEEFVPCAHELIDPPGPTAWERILAGP